MIKTLSLAIALAAVSSTARAQDANAFFIPGTDTQVTPSTAGPGFPVFDTSNSLNWLQSLGLSATQVSQLTQTINLMTNVWHVAQAIDKDVTGITGVNLMAPGLFAEGMRNPMPFPAANLNQWVGGFNDPAGIPYGGMYVAQNTIGGDPTVYDGNAIGAEIKKAVWSLSSIQAMSHNNLATIEARIFAFGDLFTQLGNIAKLQDTDSLNARINQEHAYAQQLRDQTHNLQMAWEQQKHVLYYNQIQISYQDEGAGIETACASLANSPVTFAMPECE